MRTAYDVLLLLGVVRVAAAQQMRELFGDGRPRVLGHPHMGYSQQLPSMPPLHFQDPRNELPRSRMSFSRSNDNPNQVPFIPGEKPIRGPLKVENDETISVLDSANLEAELNRYNNINYLSNRGNDLAFHANNVHNYENDQNKLKVPQESTSNKINMKSLDLEQPLNFEFNVPPLLANSGQRVNSDLEVNKSHDRNRVDDATSVKSVSSAIPSDIDGDGVERKIEDTAVNCGRESMTVTFKFSSEFSGLIYPYNRFSECLLYTGHKERSATLRLGPGFCGQQRTNLMDAGLGSDLALEHHLMVQWEPEFVSESDSSVVVRCDRPGDYNKTVSWRVGTEDLRSTVEQHEHKGPLIWMDIEQGEGPNAPTLGQNPVYVGDALTLVFTLTDEVYWFDSNIRSCYAFDGSGDERRIQWQSPEGADPNYLYAGQMLVIQDGCSTKPKLFSQFYKRRDTAPDGTKTSTHYAHFKAFRFPTSSKIQIECDVEVCYQGCRQLLPCRSRVRTRRAATDNVNPALPRDLDSVNFRKVIEVRLKEEQSAGARLLL